MLWKMWYHLSKVLRVITTLWGWEATESSGRGGKGGERVWLNGSTEVMASLLTTTGGNVWNSNHYEIWQAFLLNEAKPKFSTVVWLCCLWTESCGCNHCPSEERLPLACFVQNVNDLTCIAAIYRDSAVFRDTALVVRDGPWSFQTHHGFFSGEHLVYLGSHPLTCTWTDLRAQ